MPDSPLWLGLVGAVTGVGGLVWNGWSYRMQGARPKLQLIYGGVFEELGVIATTKRESLKQTLKGLNSASLNTDRLVAGLRVRNHGRAPLQVSGISWRTTDGDRGHNAHLLFEGSPSMPDRDCSRG
jgi:hypothetical protein